MSVLLTGDLPTIEDAIRGLAGAADGALRRALAVIRGQTPLSAQTWHAEREALADRKRQVENLCTSSLTKGRHSGVSLRFLTAAIQIATDFERVGKTGCDLALEFVGSSQREPPGAIHLVRLGDRASAMLIECSNSLWNLETRQATAIAGEQAGVAQIVADLASTTMTAVRHGSPNQAHDAVRVLGAARGVQRATEILGKAAVRLAQLGQEAEPASDRQAC